MPAQAVTPPRGKIGPGRLIVVVGPSGAGKDTLIDRARRALEHDSTYVFARRIVTRAANPHEDHDSLPGEAFAEALASGRFALAWQAHGLDYGLPCAIDDWVGEGRRVICNVSRRIIETARQRYGTVKVLYVDAPAEVLAARLRARGREENVAARMEARTVGFSPADADVVIDNGGDLEAAAAQFLEALRG